MKPKKTKIFSLLNSNKIYKALLFFLFFFSIYCSLVIGKSWDEGAHLKIGKIVLDYLFSLGRINTDHIYREHFSPVYWSLQYLLTQMFPIRYQIEVVHFIFCGVIFAFFCTFLFFEP